MRRRGQGGDLPGVLSHHLSKVTLLRLASATERGHPQISAPVKIMLAKCRFQQNKVLCL